MGYETRELLLHNKLSSYAADIADQIIEIDPFAPCGDIYLSCE